MMHPVSLRESVPLTFITWRANDFQRVFDSPRARYAALLDIGSISEGPDDLRCDAGPPHIGQRTEVME